MGHNGEVQRNMDGNGKGMVCGTRGRENGRNVCYDVGYIKEMGNRDKGTWYRKRLAMHATGERLLRKRVVPSRSW